MPKTLLRFGTVAAVILALPPFVGAARADAARADAASADAASALRCQQTINKELAPAQFKDTSD